LFTVLNTKAPRAEFQDPRSKIQDPRSKIQDPDKIQISKSIKSKDVLRQYLGLIRTGLAEDKKRKKFQDPEKIQISRVNCQTRLFPLTPTLSHRARESHSPGNDRIKGLGRSNLPPMLPLPKGSPRVRGEGAHEKIAMSGLLQSPLKSQNS
jgi:hypothetical protein